MHRTADLKIYGTHFADDQHRLIVRWRLYIDGRWNKNGFWQFRAPVTLVQIYTRAYFELETDDVYLQPCLLNWDDLKLTFK
jgi:hypothetical protein